MKNKPTRVQTNHRLLPEIIEAINMRALSSGMNARQVVESILSAGLVSELETLKKGKEVLHN